MKFRVIFLKKKHIYYTVVVLLILVLLIILMGTKKSATTFNTIAENKVIRADLTGDGKEDILYINTNSNKYYIQVNTKDTSLYLNPCTQIPTVGNYSPYWPMKITLLDINRNKIPEIFVQASENEIPINHIFIWDKKNFKDIYCSNNNLLGFTDCKTHRTPKIISGNISNDEITLSNYVLINNELHKFSSNSKDNFLGKDTILSFIKYIQSLPESEPFQPSNIFFPGLTGKELSVIGKMSGENCTYKFQDGLFMDTKWNKDGEVSEIKWVLNFKATSNLNKDSIRKYSLSLLLKSCSNKDDSFYYKIKSISKE